MDPRFLSSIFAQPPQLLGRQLRPFCCGHATLLYALKSPFTTGGLIEEADLFLAIWICSQTYQEGRQNLSRGNEYCSHGWIEWGRSVGICNFDGTIEIFQVYMEEHTRAPKRWKKKDSRPTKAPWPLTVATTLIRDLGFSETKAWNIPLQEALWYFAVIAEANGDTSLVSEEEQRRADSARQTPTENIAAAASGNGGSHG